MAAAIAGHDQWSHGFDGGNAWAVRIVPESE
jgi:hypothetical protein